MMYLWVSCGPPLRQTGSDILYIPSHKKKNEKPNCGLPFKKNTSVKKKLWKCRHSSENSILHSTEPLQSLLNDPFYPGAMSVPIRIVRPGKENRGMHTNGWVMYYSLCTLFFLANWPYQREESCTWWQAEPHHKLWISREWGFSFTSL